MICVKIELISAVHASRSREIGRLYIANDDTTGGDPNRGDYSVAVCRRGSDAVPQPLDPEGPRPTRSGAVKSYPRLSYNVWRLVARALLAAFPEEAKGIKAPDLIDAGFDEK